LVNAEDDRLALLENRFRRMRAKLISRKVELQRFLAVHDAGTAAGSGAADGRSGGGGGGGSGNTIIVNSDVDDMGEEELMDLVDDSDEL
jgi:hypothetical protein